MRALVFDRTLRVEKHHAEPLVQDGDTLLRVRQAGICSTDLEITRGYMGFAGILGHEFVADVVSSANPALVGQRVVGEINVSCRKCDLCQRGLPTHCRDRSVLGILRRHGAFAEQLRLPARNLHVLPAGVDDDQAVFVEPLAAACAIVHQLRPMVAAGLIGPRGPVTVLGDGRLGLLCAQVLKHAGYPVRVVGKHAGKLALCDAWSIDHALLSEVTPRQDQEVVVDCTGSAGGFELALRLVGPRGVIVLKSTVAAGKPLNLSPVVIDEVTVIGSRCGPFTDAITALAADQIDIRSFIHSKMPLADGVEAMRIAGTPGVLKVILTV